MNTAFRAKINPVAKEGNRPLWSVMIPTYNCANYLAKTLESVLCQDPGPEHMQIEVVDDCSTKDDPEAVVNKIGKGRVSFYRQASNVGHTKNFETCLNRSRGVLVHQLHGDDSVRLGFYKKMESLFKNNSSVGAAFCRHIFMDEEGHWQHISDLEQKEAGILENWLIRIGERQRIQTPSVVVKRAVYENLGGFDSRLSWTEDWEMWVRIASQYSVAYEPEPLAEYRFHSTSNTGKYIRSAEDLRDLQRAIEIINVYFIPEDRERMKAYSLKFYSRHGLYTANLLIKKFGDKAGAKVQLRESIRMNKSIKFLMLVAKLYRKLI